MLPSVSCVTLCGRLTFLQVSLRSKDPWDHPSSLPRDFPSAMQLQQGRGWVWPFPEHSQQVFPSFLFWSPWHLTFFMLHKDKTSYLLLSQMRRNTDLNDTKQENVFGALHRCLVGTNLPCWHCALSYPGNGECSNCQACQSPVAALNDLKVY